LSENERERDVDPDLDTDADATPALVGGFAYSRGTDRWTWTPEVYRIHGFEPHDVVPTTELIRYHLHPEDGDTLIETLWRAMDAGEPFSVLFRLVDAGGTTHNVLALGTAEPTGADRAEGLRGQMIDLTYVRDQIVHDDLRPVVEDFRTNRAVIEQAKGIVIQLLSVDADEAFERMRAYSQHANVKVRYLAGCLVAAASADRTSIEDSPGLTVEELFRVVTSATTLPDA
jgi:hypothetical protein